MICPLMSKPITVSMNEFPDILIADMHYENCAKENCVWWIEVKGYPQEKGACAMVDISKSLVVAANALADMEEKK